MVVFESEQALISYLKRNYAVPSVYFIPFFLLSFICAHTLTHAHKHNPQTPSTLSHTPSHPHLTVVFMGSEKYPGENTFDAFTNRHGGYDNASTDHETVCASIQRFWSLLDY